MIKNEKQLRVAQTKLSGLVEARDSLPAEDKSGWHAYSNLIDDIHYRITEFTQVKEGAVSTFEIRCLDDLGEALTKARISKGWTQKAFAEVLEVTEQLVQRDESRDYENAGLARLAEMLDALDFELVGEVRPKWRPTVETHKGKSLSNDPEIHFNVAPGQPHELWIGSDSYTAAGRTVVRRQAEVDA